MYRPTLSFHTHTQKQVDMQNVYTIPNWSIVVVRLLGLIATDGGIWK